MDYYGTIVKAETYFGERLNTQAWDTAIISDREKALKMATRTIDRLNFAGEKYDSIQESQFPRGLDLTVPVDIECACYEIALALLDGIDMEQEALGLGIVSDAFSGVRTTYDDAMFHDHLRAGIPSIIAWDYLKPYLNDPRQIILSRVS